MEGSNGISSLTTAQSIDSSTGAPVSPPGSVANGLPVEPTRVEPTRVEPTRVEPKRVDAYDGVVSGRTTATGAAETDPTVAVETVLATNAPSATSRPEAVDVVDLPPTSATQAILREQVSNTSPVAELRFDEALTAMVEGVGLHVDNVDFVRRLGALPDELSDVGAQLLNLVTQVGLPSETVRSILLGSPVMSALSDVQNAIEAQDFDGLAAAADRVEQAIRLRETFAPVDPNTPGLLPPDGADALLTRPFVLDVFRQPTAFGQSILADTPAEAPGGSSRLTLPAIEWRPAHDYPGPASMVLAAQRVVPASVRVLSPDEAEVVLLLAEEGRYVDPDRLPSLDALLAQRFVRERGLEADLASRGYDHVRRYAYLKDLGVPGELLNDPSRADAAVLLNLVGRELRPYALATDPAALIDRLAADGIAATVASAAEAEAFLQAGWRNHQTVEQGRQVSQQRSPQSLLRSLGLTIPDALQSRRPDLAAFDLASVTALLEGQSYTVMSDEQVTQLIRNNAPDNAAVSLFGFEDGIIPDVIEVDATTTDAADFDAGLEDLDRARRDADRSLSTLLKPGYYGAPRYTFYANQDYDVARWGWVGNTRAAQNQVSSINNAISSAINRINRASSDQDFELTLSGFEDAFAAGGGLRAFDDAIAAAQDGDLDRLRAIAPSVVAGLGATDLDVEEQVVRRVFELMQASEALIADPDPDATLARQVFPFRSASDSSGVQRVRDDAERFLEHMGATRSADDFSVAELDSLALLHNAYYAIDDGESSSEEIEAAQADLLAGVDLDALPPRATLLKEEIIREEQLPPAWLDWSLEEVRRGYFLLQSGFRVEDRPTLENLRTANLVKALVEAADRDDAAGDDMALLQLFELPELAELRRRFEARGGDPDAALGYTDPVNTITAGGRIGEDQALTVLNDVLQLGVENSDFDEPAPYYEALGLEVPNAAAGRRASGLTVAEVEAAHRLAGVPVQIPSLDEVRDALHLPTARPMSLAIDVPEGVAPTTDAVIGVFRQHNPGASDDELKARLLAGDGGYNNFSTVLTADALLDFVGLTADDVATWTDDQALGFRFAVDNAWSYFGGRLGVTASAADLRALAQNPPSFLDATRRAAVLDRVGRWSAADRARLWPVEDLDAITYDDELMTALFAAQRDQTATFDPRSQGIADLQAAGVDVAVAAEQIESAFGGWTVQVYDDEGASAWIDPSTAGDDLTALYGDGPRAAAIVRNSPSTRVNQLDLLDFARLQLGADPTSFDPATWSLSQTLAVQSILRGSLQTWFGTNQPAASTIEAFLAAPPSWEQMVRQLTTDARVRSANGPFARMLDKMYGLDASSLANLQTGQAFIVAAVLQNPHSYFSADQLDEGRVPKATLEAFIANPPNAHDAAMRIAIENLRRDLDRWEPDWNVSQTELWRPNASPEELEDLFAGLELFSRYRNQGVAFDPRTQSRADLEAALQAAGVDLENDTWYQNSFDPVLHAYQRVQISGMRFDQLQSRLQSQMNRTLGSGAYEASTEAERVSWFAENWNVSANSLTYLEEYAVEQDLELTTIDPEAWTEDQALAVRQVLQSPNDYFRGPIDRAQLQRLIEAPPSSEAVAFRAGVMRHVGLQFNSNEQRWLSSWYGWQPEWDPNGIDFDLETAQAVLMEQRSGLIDPANTSVEGWEALARDAYGFKAEFLFEGTPSTIADHLEDRGFDRSLLTGLTFTQIQRLRVEIGRGATDDRIAEVLLNPARLEQVTTHDALSRSNRLNAIEPWALQRADKGPDGSLMPHRTGTARPEASPSNLLYNLGAPIPEWIRRSSASLDMQTLDQAGVIAALDARGIDAAPVQDGEWAPWSDRLLPDVGFERRRVGWYTRTYGKTVRPENVANLDDTYGPLDVVNFRAQYGAPETVSNSNDWPSTYLYHYLEDTYPGVVVDRLNPSNEAFALTTDEAYALGYIFRTEEARLAWFDGREPTVAEIQAVIDAPPPLADVYEKAQIFGWIRDQAAWDDGLFDRFDVAVSADLARAVRLIGDHHTNEQRSEAAWEYALREYLLASQYPLRGYDEDSIGLEQFLVEAGVTPEALRQLTYEELYWVTVALDEDGRGPRRLSSTDVRGLVENPDRALNYMAATDRSQPVYAYDYFESFAPVSLVELPLDATPEEREAFLMTSTREFWEHEVPAFDLPSEEDLWNKILPGVARALDNARLDLTNRNFDLVEVWQRINDGGRSPQRIFNDGFTYDDARQADRSRTEPLLEQLAADVEPMFQQMLDAAQAGDAVRVAEIQGQIDARRAETSEAIKANYRAQAELAVSHASQVEVAEAGVQTIAGMSEAIIAQLEAFGSSHPEASEAVTTEVANIRAQVAALQELAASESAQVQQAEQDFLTELLTDIEERFARTDGHPVLDRFDDAYADVIASSEALAREQTARRLALAALDDPARAALILDDASFGHRYAFTTDDSDVGQRPSRQTLRQFLSEVLADTDASNLASAFSPTFDQALAIATIFQDSDQQQSYFGRWPTPADVAALLRDPPAYDEVRTHIAGVRFMRSRPDSWAGPTPLLQAFPNLVVDEEAIKAYDLMDRELTASPTGSDEAWAYALARSRVQGWPDAWVENKGLTRGQFDHLTYTQVQALEHVLSETLADGSQQAEYLTGYDIEYLAGHSTADVTQTNTDYLTRLGFDPSNPTGDLDQLVERAMDSAWSSRVAQVRAGTPALEWYEMSEERSLEALQALMLMESYSEQLIEVPDQQELLQTLAARLQQDLAAFSGASVEGGLGQADDLIRAFAALAQDTPRDLEFARAEAQAEVETEANEALAAFESQVKDAGDDLERAAMLVDGDAFTSAVDAMQTAFGDHFERIAAIVSAPVTEALEASASPDNIAVAVDTIRFVADELDGVFDAQIAAAAGDPARVSELTAAKQRVGALLGDWLTRAEGVQIDLAALDGTIGDQRQSSVQEAVNFYARGLQPSLERIVDDASDLFRHQIESQRQPTPVGAPPVDDPPAPVDDPDGTDPGPNVDINIDREDSDTSPPASPEEVAAMEERLRWGSLVPPPEFLANFDLTAWRDGLNFEPTFDDRGFIVTDDEIPLSQVQYRATMGFFVDEVDRIETEATDGLASDLLAGYNDLEAVQDRFVDQAQQQLEAFGSRLQGILGDLESEIPDYVGRVVEAAGLGGALITSKTALEDALASIGDAFEEGDLSGAWDQIVASSDALSDLWSVLASYGQVPELTDSVVPALDRLEPVGSELGRLAELMQTEVATVELPPYDEELPSVPELDLDGRSKADFIAEYGLVWLRAEDSPQGPASSWDEISAAALFVDHGHAPVANATYEQARGYVLMAQEGLRPRLVDYLEAQTMVVLAQGGVSAPNPALITPQQAQALVILADHRVAVPPEFQGEDAPGLEEALVRALGKTHDIAVPAFGEPVPSLDTMMGRSLLVQADLGDDPSVSYGQAQAQVLLAQYGVSDSAGEVERGALDSPVLNAFAYIAREQLIPDLNAALAETEAPIQALIDLPDVISRTSWAATELERPKFDLDGLLAPDDAALPPGLHAELPKLQNIIVQSVDNHMKMLGRMMPGLESATVDAARLEAPIDVSPLLQRVNGVLTASAGNSSANIMEAATELYRETLSRDTARFSERLNQIFGGTNAAGEDVTGAIGEMITAVQAEIVRLQEDFANGGAQIASGQTLEDVQEALQAALTEIEEAANDLTGNIQQRIEGIQGDFERSREQSWQDVQGRVSDLSRSLTGLAQGTTEATQLLFQIEANDKLLIPLRKSDQGWWQEVGNPVKMNGFQRAFVSSIQNDYLLLAGEAGLENRSDADWYHDLIPFNPQNADPFYQQLRAELADIVQIEGAIQERLYDPETGDYTGPTTLEAVIDPDTSEKLLKEVPDPSHVGQLVLIPQPTDAEGWTWRVGGLKNPMSEADRELLDAWMWQFFGVSPNTQYIMDARPIVVANAIVSLENPNEAIQWLRLHQGQGRWTRKPIEEKDRPNDDPPGGPPPGNPADDGPSFVPSGFHRGYVSSGGRAVRQVVASTSPPPPPGPKDDAKDPPPPEERHEFYVLRKPDGNFELRDIFGDTFNMTDEQQNRVQEVMLTIVESWFGDLPETDELYLDLTLADGRQLSDIVGTRFGEALAALDEGRDPDTPRDEEAVLDLLVETILGTIDDFAGGVAEFEKAQYSPDDLPAYGELPEVVQQALQPPPGLTGDDFIEDRFQGPDNVSPDGLPPGYSRDPETGELVFEDPNAGIGPGGRIDREPYVPDPDEPTLYRPGNIIPQEWLSDSQLAYNGIERGSDGVFEAIPGGPIPFGVEIPEGLRPSEIRNVTPPNGEGTLYKPDAIYQVNGIDVSGDVLNRVLYGNEAGDLASALSQYTNASGFFDQDLQLRWQGEVLTGPRLNAFFYGVDGAVNIQISSELAALGAPIPTSAAGFPVPDGLTAEGIQNLTVPAGDGVLYKPHEYYRLNGIQVLGEVLNREKYGTEQAALARFLAGFANDSGWFAPGETYDLGDQTVSGTQLNAAFYGAEGAMNIQIAHELQGLGLAIATSAAELPIPAGLTEADIQNLQPPAGEGALYKPHVYYQLNGVPVLGEVLNREKYGANQAAVARQLAGLANELGFFDSNGTYTIGGTTISGAQANAAFYGAQGAQNIATRQSMQAQGIEIAVGAADISQEESSNLQLRALLQQLGFDVGLSTRDVPPEIIAEAEAMLAGPSGSPPPLSPSQYESEEEWRFAKGVHEFREYYQQLRLSNPDLPALTSESGFTPDVERAVRAVQDKFGLERTGVPSDSLNAQLAEVAVEELVDKNYTQFLEDYIDFSATNPDLPKFGNGRTPDIAEAVKAVQRKFGMEETGIPDAALLGRLEQGANSSRAQVMNLINRSIQDPTTDAQHKAELEWLFGQVANEGLPVEIALDAFNEFNRSGAARFESVGNNWEILRDDIALGAARGAHTLRNTLDNLNPFGGTYEQLPTDAPQGEYKTFLGRLLGGTAGLLSGGGVELAIGMVPGVAAVNAYHDRLKQALVNGEGITDQVLSEAEGLSAVNTAVDVSLLLVDLATLGGTKVGRELAEQGTEAVFRSLLDEPVTEIFKRIPDLKNSAIKFARPDISDLKISREFWPALNSQLGRGLTESGITFVAETVRGLGTQIVLNEDVDWSELTKNAAFETGMDLLLDPMIDGALSPVADLASKPALDLTLKTINNIEGKVRFELQKFTNGQADFSLSRTDLAAPDFSRPDLYRALERGQIVTDDITLQRELETAYSRTFDAWTPSLRQRIDAGAIPPQTFDGLFDTVFATNHVPVDIKLASSATYLTAPSDITFVNSPDFSPAAVDIDVARDGLLSRLDDEGASALLSDLQAGGRVTDNNRLQLDLEGYARLADRYADVLGEQTGLTRDDFFDDFVRNGPRQDLADRVRDAELRQVTSAMFDRLENGQTAFGGPRTADDVLLESLFETARGMADNAQLRQQLAPFTESGTLTHREAFHLMFQQERVGPDADAAPGQPTDGFHPAENPAGPVGERLEGTEIYLDPVSDLYRYRDSNEVASPADVDRAVGADRWQADRARQQVHYDGDNTILPDRPTVGDTTDLSNELRIQYGVEASFGTRLDLAEAVAREVRRRPDLFRGKDLTLSVDVPPQKVGQPNDWVAVAVPRPDGSGRDIFINPNYTATDLALSEISMAMSGFLAAPDALNHEVGHSQASRLLGPTYDVIRTGAVPGSVKGALVAFGSRYATKNWAEAHAEYRNGLAFGRERSPTIEGWLLDTAQAGGASVAQQQALLDDLIAVMPGQGRAPNDNLEFDFASDGPTDPNAADAVIDGEQARALGEARERAAARHLQNLGFDAFQWNQVINDTDIDVLLNTPEGRYGVLVGSDAKALHNNELSEAKVQTTLAALDRAREAIRDVDGPLRGDGVGVRMAFPADTDARVIERFQQELGASNVIVFPAPTDIDFDPSMDLGGRVDALDAPDFVRPDVSEVVGARGLSLDDIASALARGDAQVVPTSGFRDSWQQVLRDATEVRYLDQGLVLADGQLVGSINLADVEPGSAAPDLQYDPTVATIDVEAEVIEIEPAGRGILVRRDVSEVVGTSGHTIDDVALAVGSGQVDIEPVGRTAAEMQDALRYASRIRYLDSGPVVADGVVVGRIDYDRIPPGSASLDDPSTALPALPPASDPNDPLLPWFQVDRSERRVAPPTVEFNGQTYDIAGATEEGVRLEGANNRPKYIQTEELFMRGYNRVGDGVDTDAPGRARRTVTYGNSTKQWGLDGIRGTGANRHYVLVDPAGGPSRNVPLSQASQLKLRFSPNGPEYSIGASQHGVVRLTPVNTVPARVVAFDDIGPVQVRLKDRELYGLFTVEQDAAGRLVATGQDRYGQPVSIEVQPEDIQSRYVETFSPDFERADGDGAFLVDAFEWQEAWVRAASDTTGTNRPLQRDPFVGTADPATRSFSEPGADVIERMTEFLSTDLEGPIDIFNIAVEESALTQPFFDALTRYKTRNPDTPVRIFMYGPAVLENPTNRDLVFRMQQIGVEVVLNQRQTERTVNHAKGIVASDRALITTGAIYQKTERKLDITTELSADAAKTYRAYFDGLVNGGVTAAEQRSRLADLAQHGVFINDPITDSPFVARAINDIIAHADRTLDVTLSDMRDPLTAERLVEQARQRGVEVNIEYREIDDATRQILDDAVAEGLPITVRDVSGMRPYPHYNYIGKDMGDPSTAEAYVGSAYIWGNQLRMAHHGRSWENGIRLAGEGAIDLHQQVRRQVDGQLGPAGPLVPVTPEGPGGLTPGGAGSGDGTNGGPSARPAWLQPDRTRVLGASGYTLDDIATALEDGTTTLTPRPATDLAFVLDSLASASDVLILEAGAIIADGEAIGTLDFDGFAPGSGRVDLRVEPGFETIDTSADEIFTPVRTVPLLPGGPEGGPDLTVSVNRAGTTEVSAPAGASIALELGANTPSGAAIQVSVGDSNRLISPSSAEFSIRLNEPGGGVSEVNVLGEGAVDLESLLATIGVGNTLIDGSLRNLSRAELDAFNAQSIEAADLQFDPPPGVTVGGIDISNPDLSARFMQIVTGDSNVVFTSLSSGDTLVSVDGVHLLFDDSYTSEEVDAWIESARQGEAPDFGELPGTRAISVAGDVVSSALVTGDDNIVSIRLPLPVGGAIRGALEGPEFAPPTEGE